jgi:hypothetical protein
MVFIDLLRDMDDSSRADHAVLSLLDKLSVSPQLAIAIFSRQPRLLGSAGLDALAAPAYLRELQIHPHKLGHYCPLAHCSAMEALLDCPDDAVAIRLASALARPPSPRQFAAVFRRSLADEELPRRMDNARRRGWVSGPLLRLLADHSSWCGNGVASLAQALRDERALDKRIGPVLAKSARTGARI